MGHQNLTLAAVALLAAVAVGCQPSVELEPEPRVPAPTADEAPPADEPAKSASGDRVEINKPVERGNRAGGYLGAVAGGYRSAREELESLGVRQAIDHYHASTGEYPKSHDEFMNKVWKPLQTPLPEVEEGYELRYDPEDHKVYKVPIEEANEGE